MIRYISFISGRTLKVWPKNKGTTMSEDVQNDSTSDTAVESPAPVVASEPTLRARISAWLGQRPLASVLVAAVLAMLVGIGIGSASGGPGEHGNPFGQHQQDWRHGGDEDGGPGMMGPGQGQFGPGGGSQGQFGPGGQPGQGGPGMMGPGQGQFGPGTDGQVPPVPQVSPSATTN